MKKLIIAIFILISIVVAFFVFKNKKNMSDIKLSGFEFKTTNQALITTNTEELQATIQKAFTGNLPNNGKMFIVYKDYENNFLQDIMNKKLTIFVGFEGTSSENENSEIVHLTIPVQKYEIFKTQKGEASKVVYQEWQNIWQNKELANNRSFKYDFEVYNLSESPQNSEVAIYIGIK